MKTSRRLLGFFQAPRAILHILLFSVSPAKVVIEKDVARWVEESFPPDQRMSKKWKRLVWLLWRCQAFRNLFYYRIEREERIISRAIAELAKLFYRPIDTLYIYTPIIGAGLYIQHGFSTIISAKSIGENCWINQQVTIGFTNLTDTPTIGNGVRITAGAKVFGNITIGDNSVIGANAVVFKNVPPNCTVVGVPAYIAKCDGKKVRIPL